MLQSEAGYIDARPHVRQLDEILLQRAAGPYMWVKPRSPPSSRMSGFTSSRHWSREEGSILQREIKIERYTPLTAIFDATSDAG
jgi:hypothetical protein